MLQIAMLIIGIIALVKGKVTFSKKRVVTGGLARLLGLLMLTPFPLGLVIGIGWGVMLGAQGKSGEQIEQEIGNYALMIDVGLVIGVGLLVVFLGYLWGKDPSLAMEAQLVDDYSRPLPPRSTSNNPYEPPASH